MERGKERETLPDRLLPNTKADVTFYILQPKVLSLETLGNMYGRLLIN